MGGTPSHKMGASIDEKEAERSMPADDSCATLFRRRATVTAGSEGTKGMVEFVCGVVVGFVAGFLLGALMQSSRRGNSDD